MISSKLYILVVASLAAFAVASPGQSEKLTARGQCPIGQLMCCRKTRGSIAYRKLAIEKLGALVGRYVNSQSIVWVGCSTNLSEDSHHSFNCNDRPVCCANTASDLSIALNCKEI